MMLEDFFAFGFQRGLPFGTGNVGTCEASVNVPVVPISEIGIFEVARK